MTKVSASLIILVLQLALVSCVGAQSVPLIHYEFEGDYSNSGTGTVAGQPRSGATIVADPGGGLKGASNVLKFYGNDEYVKVGNDDVGSITTALTVAAWVKSDGTNWSNAGIVTRGYNWRLYISGSANGTIQCMNTAPGSKSRGSVNINEGEWHHVAGTYDGTQYILYIDGVQDGPAVPATGPIAQTTSHKFTIGAFESSGNVSMFYDGYIDDVRVYDEALDPMAIQGLVEGEGATITVEAGGDISAANEIAEAGDTLEFAEGTYYITSQIEIKDGVTYKGAGPGLTIIDGNDVTRAFVAWGDRGATDGQVDVNGVSVLNATGPTDWVLEGLTIQNCVSDANNRQSILSAARDLLDNYPGAAYTLATAQEENGGITDNPGWFDILSGSADPNLTDVELQAYLDGNPLGSAGHIVVNGDKDDDGGAVNLDNGAAGTIRNCAFSNNWAVNDGGVIEVNGRAAVAIQNCTFSNNSSDDDGGAISGNGSGLAVSIENCEFNSCSNNDGDDGGALFLSGNESTYIVTDSNFTGCISDDDGGVAYSDGHDSSYAFSNCTLHLNTCGDEGGALKLSAQRSTVTLTDIIITYNYAGDDAGAVRTDGDDSSYVFTDCSFIGNYCNDDYAAHQHKTDRAELTMTNCEFISNGIDANGVVVSDDSVWGLDDDDAGPVTLINCLFAYNACNDDWVIELKAAFSLLNCTFIGNESADGSKSMIGVRGRPWNSTGDKDANGDDIDDVITNESIISNCLFINNTTMGPVIGDTYTDVFAPTVINCLFYGNLVANTDDNSPEVGTIDVSAVTDAAQIVVDPAGDYHLVAGSAAIDASDPATATASDIEGTAVVGVRDVGAYEFVGGNGGNDVVVGNMVDDFENYHAQTAGDPGAIFNVWVDGYLDENNGSTVGNEPAPFAEQVNVHGGQQAMPLFYDNTGNATYSEATRTFGLPQDWSQTGGVAFFFKGVPENTLGQLYMKINDTKVLYLGDAANLQSGLWQLWYVSVANFAGDDLTNVQTLTIGVESGGKGVLYIDDIELDNP